MDPVGDRGYRLTATEVARALKQNPTQFEIFIDGAVADIGDGDKGVRTLIFADAPTTRKFKEFCKDLRPPIIVRERGR